MNAGVFICTCNVQSVEYNCCKKHAFVYDSHFKPLHQTKCCGVLIDNRADAPICVLEDKERESKKKKWLVPLENSFLGSAMWKMYT